MVSWASAQLMYEREKEISNNKRKVAKKSIISLKRPG